MQKIIKRGLMLPVSLFMGLCFAYGAPPPNIQQQIQQYHYRHLALLRKKVDELGHTADKRQQQKRFTEARLLYKHIEFIVAYVDSKEVLAINGPNLITDEYDGLAPQIVYPHGLQVIEERVYRPQTTATEPLRQECERLSALLSRFEARRKNTAALDDQTFHSAVWDALRYGIYRVESLGITGFDVPLCRQAIPETGASLGGMWTVIELYAPLFHEKKMQNSHRKGRQLFSDAIAYTVAHPDFETFDRLQFIRRHLTPISVWLTTCINTFGWTLPANLRPINTRATHLFAENIFNPAYFQIPADSTQIALGQKLFHDPVLSGTDRSCASCHIPQKAFTDGLPKAILLQSNALARNTPTLWNAGLQTALFYDSRVKKLEKQAFAVIHNTAEMGGNLAQAVEIIRTDSSYREAFAQTFAHKINEHTVVAALSAYIRSLFSFSSRVDRYIRGEEVDITPAEKNGFNLFTGKAKCATCHFMPLFNGLLPPFYTHTESESIGVPISAQNPGQIDPDPGRFGFTALPLHRYLFKTPGIRHASGTAPYMHNGVFATLPQVLDFYNHGGGAGQGISPALQTLQADSLHLTPSEINDIIAFLQSM